MGHARVLSLAATLMLFRAWGAAQTPQDTLILYFAGDVMQHRAQLDRAYRPDSRTYDYSGCFNAMYPEIRRAQFAFCNLETTLGDTLFSGYPAFCSPVQLASALKEAGFDICLTANNHCLDRGSKGLVRTISVLDSLGLKHLGTYSGLASRNMQYPFMIEWKKRRIALLNCTYGTNGIPVPEGRIVNLIDTVQLGRDIIAARARGADCIIACMHWGTEYMTRPDREQLRIERWLYAKGVDHIIGGHPHVVQPVQEYRNDRGGLEHLTVWSLGNYISAMTAQNTFDGLAVTLFLVAADNGLELARYELHPNTTLRPDFRVTAR